VAGSIRTFADAESSGGKSTTQPNNARPGHETQVGCGLTPELSCKGKYKNAREASIINSSFDSFSVRSATG
jgi:hypothetical protein